MKNKKQWKDFSTATKVRIMLAGVVQITLLLTALWDIRHRSAEQIKGSKKLWYSVVFINYIGPIAYFVLGRKPNTSVIAA